MVRKCSPFKFAKIRKNNKTRENERYITKNSAKPSPL